MISNGEFLRALFGAEAHRVHVTGFSWDPNEIPSERHLQAWAGGAASEQPLSPDHNNYFTISLFHPDEKGKARRRKALFEATHVVVLDDVGEKLSESHVQRLPEPTYVLESSPGSEQWGYKLAVPETSRARVENLQDGLVASGLAPDGKDPGMKGVTRYVRLPDGRNTKQAKMLFGVPYKCRLTYWEPRQTVTMEELAAPFGIDLDAARREQRVDGATDIPNHPVLDMDSIQVKEIRGPGRYDIVCPWVDEHTGAADDGAAVFTNEDGSVGFQCHHGACEGRTAGDLLSVLEQERPGFRAELKRWQLEQALGQTEAPNFMAPPAPRPPEKEEASGGDALRPLLDQLRRALPGSGEASRLAESVLREAEDLKAMDTKTVHDEVREAMDWSKQEFNQLLKSLRQEWYQQTQREFQHSVMYVKAMDAFYDWRRNIFHTVQGFSNSYMDEDENVRTAALRDGTVVKVDHLDYAPGQPRVFQEQEVTLGNMYSDDDHVAGIPGDASPWLNHWAEMGWGGKTRDHMLKYMAFTLRYPERKINHMMILGSPQGSGKDFLLTPLQRALGSDATTIEGEELTSDFTSFLRSTKYLHINEAELGGRREATQVVNKLKPIAAAPPHTLRVNEKNQQPMNVRNIINGTLCTNSRLPLKLQDSRRFYAVWSDLTVRQPDGNVDPEWNEYWQRLWDWMDSGGAENCIWYLENCVDLSDFNPGEPPPMTAFMQDIQELSKSPTQKTIEMAISEGLITEALMTTTDIMSRLSNAQVAAPGVLQVPMSKMNNSRLEVALQELGITKIPVNTEHMRTYLWALRDGNWYAGRPDSELVELYLRERNPKGPEETEGSPMKLVRGDHGSE